MKYDNLTQRIMADLKTSGMLTTEQIHKIDSETLQEDYSFSVESLNVISSDVKPVNEKARTLEYYPSFLSTELLGAVSSSYLSRENWEYRVEDPKIFCHMVAFHGLKQLDGGKLCRDLISEAHMQYELSEKLLSNNRLRRFVREAAEDISEKIGGILSSIDDSKEVLFGAMYSAIKKIDNFENLYTNAARTAKAHGYEPSMDKEKLMDELWKLLGSTGMIDANEAENLFVKGQNFDRRTLTLRDDVKYIDIGESAYTRIFDAYKRNLLALNYNGYFCQPYGVSIEEKKDFYSDLFIIEAAIALDRTSDPDTQTEKSTNIIATMLDLTKSINTQNLGKNPDVINIEKAGETICNLLNVDWEAFRI